MQAIAALLYCFVRGFGSFVVLALYFDVSFGGVMPLHAVVISEHFGARVMGASYGAVFQLSCLAWDWKFGWEAASSTVWEHIQACIF
jgi:hypothetical protein